MTTAPERTSPTVPRLLAMLAGASTLRERLDREIETSGDGAVARARLERWCQVVAAGDPVRLRRRLEWDGLSLPDALDALGDPRGLEAEAPRWLKLLALVLAHGPESLGQNPLADRSGSDPPVPFEEILSPFVAVAAAQLYADVHPASGGLGSGGRLGLERALMVQLSTVCGPALYRAFEMRRATSTSTIDRLVAMGLGSVDGYSSFAGDMLGGGLETFFVEHPVLARLAATVALNWMDWAGDFMRRLADDRAELIAAFARGQDPGPLTAVAAGLSDPHDGGRSVLKLAFASGLELAYKPRDVRLEKGYEHLVGWLNEHGAEPALRAPRVLERPGYGWVEWVHQQPASDLYAAAMYYRRAGMLMALFYGLGSTDCHRHNLVAAGEHPVLIDAETLLHPRVLPHGSDSQVRGARTVGRRWMEESIFEADYLPAWTFAADGRRIDISALGGVEPQRSVLLTPRWERVNSDAMSLAWVHEELSQPPSALRMGDRIVLPWDFSDEIAEGFAAGHRLLEERGQQLLAAGGPLDRLRSTPVRLIVRPTTVYQKILDASCRLQLLREGVDRGIELEVTARPLLETQTRDPFWALHREEQAALEGMDIPRFTMAAGSRLLNVGGGTVEGVMATSPLEHAAERLARFDEGDRERQVALIRLALHARAGTGHGREDVPAGAEVAVDPQEHTAAEVADDQLLAAALAIGERLQRSAIRAPDGGLTWIGLSYDQQGSRLALRPIGLDLYSGQCGLAVFFAALAAVTGEARYRELALGALQPVVTTAEEGPAQLAEECGIGGATGLGSVVYGLVACARLLKEPALLTGAESLARALSRERVDRDRELDVMAGSAGALLGLLSLHEATGSTEALSRAVLCGEHLLARRTATTSGLRAWRSHADAPLAGFGHGAAGAAYALLLASAVCERPDFREGAEEGIAYEAALFDRAERNWPDLRPAPPEGRRRRSAWCHGASGIGLARLGALDVLDTPQVRADVMAAVLTTRMVGTGTADQVCCGAMGRVEALQVAGARLSTSQLHNEARDLAAQTLLSAQRRGSFRLAGGPDSEAYSPGFFQGVSGIGYQFLRLVRPELPSILLFEVD